MQSSWKREQRRTIWLAITILAIWAFAIYWQGNITWAGFIQSMEALGRLDFQSIPSPFGSLILDSLLLLGGFIFWTFFFAHFVLPIQNPGQAIDVAKTMLRSLSTQRPSAVFIRNGKFYPQKISLQTGKTRIWLLDSASAAVLRNDTGFTRAIGPGLSFAKEEERLAGLLDLRIQHRFNGPLDGEDPFQNKKSSEDTPAYEARQERRKESSAITRDGVEIVPRIEVEFRIEGRKNAQSSPFPFQAEFAWRAIANEGVALQSPSDIRQRQVSWDWLPNQLAADLWREYLRKFTLQELFEEIDAPNKKNGKNASHSGMEYVRLLVSDRLQKSIIEDRKGNKSSSEYQLLRNRGIRVVNVKLREIHLDSSRDEMRLVNEWSESWEIHAMRKEFEMNREIQNIKSEGQREAASEFIHLLGKDLQTRLNAIDRQEISPPDARESLGLLLNSTLRNAETLDGLDSSVLSRIRLMQSWLQDGEKHAG
jgi:hypothetical protein